MIPTGILLMKDLRLVPPAIKRNKATIGDIAGRLGISSTTVSFVLNGRDFGISEITRKKVTELAVKLGYRTMASVRKNDWIKAVYLAENIAWFNFRTSFYAHVYSYLHRYTDKRKISLSLMEFPLNENQPGVLAAENNLKIADADIILTNSRAIAAVINTMGVKCILVQAGVLTGIMCVSCDDESAGKLSAEYAVKMGYQQAGMIFPEKAMSSPRFRGFYQTFTGLGGKISKHHIWQVSWEHAEMESSLEKLSGKKNLPALFYCFADNLLFPAIRAFHKNNLQVPKDISLIGTDDLYWGRFACPAFTTVNLQEELFAERLVETIVHIAGGGSPYHLTVPCKFVERESVRRNS